MNISSLLYPAEELAKQDELNSLFKEWYSSAKTKSFPHDMSAKDIVFDGFYPYYSNQKCKILYIGRESLGLIGENYIDLLHHAYKQDKAIGKQSINQHRLHSLMLSIAHGLNNDIYNWKDIPLASVIADSFATKNGVSFAFMNLSKLSNESGDWQVDWELVDGFTEAFKNSSTNYFSKQIDIICPDIILTMNLESRLECFGDLKLLDVEDCAAYYTLKTAEKEYFLIDLYHFSAIKDKKECFYDPIIRGINKFK